MEFYPELFLTTKERDVYGRYREVLSGAFYDVYVGDDGSFHMAKEEEASLRERLGFYKEFILKEKTYPVFDAQFGLADEESNTLLCFQQVLGLPVEVFQARDGAGNPIWLTPDAVLERITFEKGLFFGYGEIDRKAVTYDILRGNDYCVVGLCNYLVSKGIYFPNVEKLISDDIESFPDYPVFIDPDKAPKEFLEKVSPSKLFLDFRIPGTDFDAKGFRRYAAFVDGMSPQERIRFAFRNDRGELDDVRFGAKLILRNYFSALLKDMVNTFFVRQYGITPLFKRTVLDHDSGWFPYRYRYFYVGSNFIMHATSDLQIINKDGKREIHEKQGKYCFSKQDIAGLKTAFDAVRLHFEKKGMTPYPELFLRWMGVPYPALESVRYFSFRRGDAEAFVRLFQDVDDFDYLSSGLPALVLDDFGEVLLADRNSYDFLPYLFARHGIFFLYEDLSLDHLDCRLYLEKGIQKQIPNPLSYVFLKPFIDRLFAQEKTNKKGGEMLRLLSQDKEGNYLQILEFVRRMLDGHSSFTIAEDLFHVDPSQVSELNGLAVDLLKEILLDRLPDVKKDIDSPVQPLSGQRYMDIEDEESPSMSIFMTERTICIEEEGHLYFPESERETLASLEAIHDRFFHGKNPSYLGVRFFERRGKVFLDPSDPFEKATFVTGLGKEAFERLGIDPTKKVVPQLSFREDIDFFSEDKMAKLCQVPGFLEFLTSRALWREGIYLVGDGSLPSSVLVLPDARWHDVDRLVDPECAAIGTSWEYHLAKARYGLRTKAMDFYRRQGRQISGADFSDEFAPVTLSYLVSVGTGIFDAMKEEVRPLSEADNDRGIRGFALSFRDSSSGLFVAPGHFFYAYCDTPEGKDFFLPSEDRASFLLIDRILRDNVPSSSAVKRDFYVLNRLYGLPQVLWPTFLDERRVSFRHLPMAQRQERYSLFAPGQIQESVSDPYLSTAFFHAALKEGFVFFSEENLVSDELLDYDGLCQNLPKGCDAIAEPTIFIAQEALSGLAKALFLPDPQTFECLLGQFIERFSRTSLSAEFLFYVKEALVFAYDRDRTFLIQAINALQFHGNFKTYIRRFLRGYRLKELEEIFPVEFAYDFISFFLLFVEQEYCIRLRKALKI